MNTVRSWFEYGIVYKHPIMWPFHTAFKSIVTYTVGTQITITLYDFTRHVNRLNLPTF